MSERKLLTIGILAHVDAGKTTLSEAMLYTSGTLRSIGRVDHGDAFFDTDAQERARGITIFSKQAQMDLAETTIQLVDSPGHADFSAEMERILPVLDYAVLVVSGKELIQGHTLTVWRLLKRYSVPVFIFVNKMDLDGTDQNAAMQALRGRLDEGCVLFEDWEGAKAGRSAVPDPDELAVCGEELLEAYLEEGGISDNLIAKAIAERKVFPCFFGSALKVTGVEEFMAGLDRYTLAGAYGEEFSARVYKITRDERGARLTHMKITGGTLCVRDLLRTAEEESEKVSQIRIYAGDKYRTVESAGPGMVCAVCGLEHTVSGQGLGTLSGTDAAPVLQPVLTYRLTLPEEVDLHTALAQLRQLQEEDPQLQIRWNAQLQEIQVRLMGSIQMEILQNQIRRRFGYVPAFDEGRIEYRETIRGAVIGSGHFEPLRHYAEAHLLLEPLPAGSGLEFASGCSSDELDTNWQRLILTHLAETEHPGVLVGAPITDMKITILGGRAHAKHTEGGDFRQATYRALRQGLRKSEPVLLEPWYEYTLEVPPDMTGRAMSDLQRMGGSFQLKETSAQETAVLTGRAPVSEMKAYLTEVTAYTRGRGHLTCVFGGYEECHNADEVIAESGYDPDRDAEHPADSIFCSHGAGRMVPWNEADAMMHLQFVNGRPARPETGEHSGGEHAKISAGDEKDLKRIFERTYGKREHVRPARAARVIESRKEPVYKLKREDPKPEYLLVDGYNIIFAWDELKELASVSIDAAREALTDILSNYRGFRKCEVILVFDAYKVKGGTEHTEKHGGITVVFTGEAETADTYIERATYEMKKKYHVRVATSDRLEQMIILGNDAFRVSAGEFRREVMQVDDQIREILARRRQENEKTYKNRITLPLHTE